MRSLKPRVVSCILAVFFPALRALAAQGFEVPWSSNRYGPDGPWQAVKITLGGLNTGQYISVQSHEDVDVYPGGAWESASLTKDACEPYPNSICGSGGFWEPDPTDLENLTTISFPYTAKDDSLGVQMASGSRTYMATTIAGKTVYNSTLAYIEEANITYPNGKVGGLPLGKLSLGAASQTQTFTLSNQIGDSIDAFTFPGGLYNNSEIPSYSFGLHIGAAAFDYPGSLVFGGYNKGRVIEPVTSFKDESVVDLLDIGIGVEDGDSPFTFTSKEGLFLDSSGQTQRRNVSINPLNPYLALPKKTCDGLAKLLPVTFDDSLNYYTWNVNDSSYKNVVQSPAYLSFTFPPPPGASENIVIKVPFALLNLTLDQPITNTPTQYFPCHPYDVAGSIPVLGRAFLQAAFFGRNWETGYSWLAQAPGPGTGITATGLGDSRTDIAKDANIIAGFKNDGGVNLFNQSWSQHWTVTGTNSIASNVPGPTATDASSHKGLSTGAKAGIGAGVGVFALAALAAAAFLLWRRKNIQDKSENPYSAKPLQDVKSGTTDVYQYDAGNIPEHTGVAQPIYLDDPVEAPASRPPQEVADTNDPRFR